MFQENNIVVAGLPAHKSHALKPMDLSVFSPMKEAFKRPLSRRAVCTIYQGNTRNDVFTVCELLRMSYQECVIARNVVAGFRKSGIWSDVLNARDPAQISEADFT